MGDAGVASTPDANSLHWNPAKYAFIQKDMGFSVSYSPWLRALVNDINLAYLSGYKKFGKDQAVAASLLYFHWVILRLLTLLETPSVNSSPANLQWMFAIPENFRKNFPEVLLFVIFIQPHRRLFVGGAESHLEIQLLRMFPRIIRQNSKWAKLPQNSQLA